jgi:hypothetical protein
MRNTIFRGLVFAVIVGTWAFATAWGATNFYVSTKGNDNNIGTLGSPFATISKAKQAVGILVNVGLKDSVNIYFREGEYYLGSSLNFTEADSGTDKFSVTYKAYPGEEVHITGGKEIPAEWFAKLDDPNYFGRLAVSDPNLIYVADLQANGINDYGDLVYRGFAWDDHPSALELFYNYQPMRLARWPNAGYEIAYPTPDKSSLKFTYNSGVGNSDHWETADQMWIHGFLSNYYGDAIIPVQAIQTADRAIELENAGSEYALLNWKITPVYYVFNLLEELDQPGEWFLNRDTGKLYFYPPGDLAQAKIHVSLADTLLTFKEAHHITFDGLIFEMSRGRAVALNGVQTVRFMKCVFRNGGMDAVYVNGTASGLDSCAIYGMGDGGVTLRGGDRTTLTSSLNYLTNTEIHHLSRWGKTNKMAALLRDCGQTVQYNLIHDLPAIAIMYRQSNENQINYNEIYNVCQEVDDNGVIYSGRDWTARGNAVLYNFIHHVNRIPDAAVIANGGNGVQGIFLDEGASGSSILGNIFYNIDGSAIKISGGRDNIAENNIFAYCPGALQISRMINSPQFNDIYITLRSRLLDIEFRKPPWSEKYPLLASILSDSPQDPNGNVLNRSAAYHVDNMVVEQLFPNDGGNPRQFLKEANNQQVVDPKFVDEENFDLQLLPGSPILQISGWQAIPFEQIGPVPDVQELQIALQECQAVEVRGSCPPWASLGEAIIGDPPSDVSSYIQIKDNGAIYGRIPRSAFLGQNIKLSLSVSDPQGDLCNPVESNAVAVTPLIDYPAWPTEISVQVEEVIDVPVPLYRTDAKYTWDGLPAAARITSKGRLYWPTQVADAGNYTADITVTLGNVKECATITIHIGNKPQAPTLLLAIQDCTGYIVSGQCERWATFASAAVPGLYPDAKGLLAIDAMGNITGRIPTNADYKGPVMLKAVLAGPGGALSPEGHSNILIPTDLVPDAGWPGTISVKVEQPIEASIVGAVEGVTYELFGMPAGAMIDADGNLLWQTTTTDGGSYQPIVIVHKGANFECHSFDVEISDLPAQAAIQLSMQVSDGFTVAGTCERWAKVNEATIVETGQSVKTSLQINPDGTLTGLLLKRPILSDTVTLKVVLEGPTGKLSPASISNAFTYSELIGFFNWPKDADVKAGEALVIAAPKPSCGKALKFSAEGLPPSAQVDQNTGAITWQTTLADVGVYNVKLTATDDHCCESGNLAISVSDDAFSPMAVTECTITAKGERGEALDSIRVGGTLKLDAASLLDASQIDFIVSGGGRTVIQKTLPFTIAMLQNGIFTWKGAQGGLTELTLNMFAGTYTGIAKNIDLTGLRSPVKVEIVAGSYHGVGMAYDAQDYLTSGGQVPDVINRGKPAPLALLDGQADAIQIVKAKYSWKKNVGTIKLTGNLSLAGEPANLNQTGVTAQWGNYTRMLMNNGLIRKGNKNVYQYKSPLGGVDPIKQASFDLDKGKFSLTITDAQLVDQGNPVSFKLSFGSFNQTVLVFLPGFQSQSNP